jgi:hypothetical protein
MSEDTKRPDETDEPEEKTDVEGHSMFLYEHARTVARDHEREVQNKAREARMLDQRKGKR